MSVDYNVYLGPYLQCEYSIGKTQRYEWVCMNQRCDEYDIPAHSKFCGACGKQLTKIIYEIEEPSVNCRGLVEEINEVLMPVPLEGIKLNGPFHIWIPNVNRNQPRKFHYDPHCDLCVVSVEDHLGEVIWFTEAFLKEIKVLKKHYKECLGQWGLIIYSS